jgi:hypothetical protein
VRIFELGHQRGQELGQRLKTAFSDAVICDCDSANWECAPECATTIQIPTPWGNMSGHFDAWVPSLRTIVDFKTAGNYSMGKVLGGEEDERYALQLNAYRHGIMEKYEPVISLYADIRTILVYEAKDSDARKGVAAGMLHEVEVPYTPALEEAYQAKLKAWAILLDLKRNGSLQPLDISGVFNEGKGGKPHWRCSMDKEGKPKYCSIGPIRGQCK